jgi:hypothetical protein
MSPFASVPPFRSVAGNSIAIPAVRQWYLVRIDHPQHPTIRASNAAFRSVLLSAYHDMVHPEGCHVYSMGDDFTGYSYFFSREAARQFEALIKLWQGIGVAEPTNLQSMQNVI